MNERRASTSAWQSLTTNPLLSDRSLPTHLLPVAHASTRNPYRSDSNNGYCKTTPDNTVQSSCEYFFWHGDELNQFWTALATRVALFIYYLKWFTQAYAFSCELYWSLAIPAFLIMTNTCSIHSDVHCFLPIDLFKRADIECIVKAHRED